MLLSNPRMTVYFSGAPHFEQKRSPGADWAPHLEQNPAPPDCAPNAFRRRRHHRKAAPVPMSRAGATPRITTHQPKAPLPEPVIGTGDESGAFNLSISEEIRESVFV